MPTLSSVFYKGDCMTDRHMILRQYKVLKKEKYISFHVRHCCLNFEFSLGFGSTMVFSPVRTDFAFKFNPCASPFLPGTTQKTLEIPEKSYHREAIDILSIDAGLPDWNPASEESIDSVEARVYQWKSSLYSSADAENSADLDDSLSERSRTTSASDDTSGSVVLTENKDVRYYSPFGTGVTSWLASGEKVFRRKAKNDVFGGGVGVGTENGSIWNGDSLGSSPASSADGFLPMDKWTWNQFQTSSSSFQPEIPSSATTSPLSSSSVVACDVVCGGEGRGGKRREPAIGDEMKTRFLSSKTSSSFNNNLRSERDFENDSQNLLLHNDDDERKRQNFCSSDDLEDVTKLAAILGQIENVNRNPASGHHSQMSCGHSLGLTDGSTRLTKFLNHVQRRQDAVPVMYMPIQSYYVPNFTTMMTPPFGNAVFHPMMMNGDYHHSSLAGYPYFLPQQTFFYPSNDSRNLEQIIYFDGKKQFIRQVGPASELHARLDECFDQFRHLENERKKVEAELARQNPGKSVTSCNDLSSPSMPQNPSRIDRLVVEMFQEHARVVTLLSRMEQLCGLKLRKNLEAKVDYWSNGIQKLQSCRKNEILNRKKRCLDNGAILAQKQKDVVSLTEALANAMISTRRVRSALWCALQLSSVDLPKRCISLAESAAKHSYAEPVQRASIVRPPFETCDEADETSDYEGDEETGGNETDHRTEEDGESDHCYAVPMMMYDEEEDGNSTRKQSYENEGEEDDEDGYKTKGENDDDDERSRCVDEADSVLQCDERAGDG